MHRDRNRVTEIECPPKQHQRKSSQEAKRDVETFGAGQHERGKADRESCKNWRLAPLAGRDPSRTAACKANHDNADTGRVEEVLAAIADEEFRADADQTCREPKP